MLNKKNKLLLIGFAKVLFAPKYLPLIFSSKCYYEFKLNLRSIANGSLFFNSNDYSDFFQKNIAKKKVLLVSHELSFTGAPNVLYSAALHLKNNGYAPFVFTLKDGPMREKFESIGIPVHYINICKFNKDDVLPFVKQFDFSISNTIVSYEFVNQFDNDIKNIWWIHEATMLAPFVKARSKFLPKLLQNANIVCCGPYYVKENIQKFRKKEVRQLNYYRDEFSKMSRTENFDKIVFAIMGSVEPRKAQDIAIKAFISMPENYKNKSVLNIVGRGDHFMLKLKEKTKVVENIIWKGIIKDTNLYRQELSNTDVMVSVSRDDPDPVVVTEAGMIGVPSIISDKVGQKAYINNGENGFIVPVEDVDALKNVMMNLIDNPDKIKSVGTNARSIWEDNYSEKVFSLSLHKILFE
ncbi:MAG: glycosyltransferase family 4 protein [Candidatus Gastranaerophilales bacterium]|nr:glycosyltransferase family 4 protein [Candidatus Gastranaerophilales bacterium]